ncbi:Glycosyl hydrolase family 98 putative carbohydrate binding module [Actinobacteria bacterium OV450]|nr:Glycosyl hydrolase family 98 putative carbohydrate binding module [Actinobacteria bacterium OV450]
MTTSPPPGAGIPPLPPTPPNAQPAPSPRRLGEVAALVSAGTAVLGLLLGFLGLPVVLNSPTARTVTEAPHATVTVTVTASSPVAAGGPAEPSAPAALPSGEVALRDRPPTGSFDREKISLSSATLGGKAYQNAMVYRYPCQDGPEYSLNQRYKTLTFTVGLDDNGIARPGKFSVIGDGTEIKSVMLEINHPQTVTVDTSSVINLRLQPDLSEPNSCNADGVVVVLADAVLRS